MMNIAASMSINARLTKKRQYSTCDSCRCRILFSRSSACSSAIGSCNTFGSPFIFHFPESLPTLLSHSIVPPLPCVQTFSHHACDIERHPRPTVTHCLQIAHPFIPRTDSPPTVHSVASNSLCPGRTQRDDRIAVVEHLAPVRDDNDGTVMHRTDAVKHPTLGTSEATLPDTTVTSEVRRFISSPECENIPHVCMLTVCRHVDTSSRPQAASLPPPIQQRVSDS